MIPKNIKKEHILKAMQEVDRIGTPESRSSKKFTLEYNGRQYSPKYVISLANKFASGKELDPSEFSGGNETNNFLKSLGFNVLMTQSLGRPAYKPSVKHKEEFPKVVHNERCTRCKETIRAMLEKIYGKVETNYKFEIGNYPEDFRNTSSYETLKEIYEALQNQRGFKEFIKSKTLPNCDFFVPNPGFIVEFDESQHFTMLRKIALEHYPEKLEFGFDRKRWMALCEKINAKDNEPLYRDEQRAWYDTLRDFLPPVKGLKPTIRLFARDYQWCSLKPTNLSDVEKFKSFLRNGDFDWGASGAEKHLQQIVSVADKQNENHTKHKIARLIVTGKQYDKYGNPNFSKLEKLIEKFLATEYQKKTYEFILTPGGFLTFYFPDSLQHDLDIVKAERQSITLLQKEANSMIVSFFESLNPTIFKKLKDTADYFTIGIDGFNPTNYQHIELVAVYDLKKEKVIYWTGKFYPTEGQKNNLIKINNLDTHFIKLNNQKIVILGCHDLNVFSPRGQATANPNGWKKQLADRFKSSCQKFNPEIILHHPHTTDTPNIWNLAWRTVEKELPNLKHFASGIKYYNRNGVVRGDIDKVLKKTKKGDVIDFYYD